MKAVAPIYPNARATFDKTATIPWPYFWGGLGLILFFSVLSVYTPAKYLFHTFSTCACSIVLLFQMRRNTAIKWPIMALFVLLLWGYLGKALYCYLAIKYHLSIPRVATYTYILKNKTVLDKAYYVSNVGVITFCITSSPLLFFSRKEFSYGGTFTKVLNRRSIAIFCLLAIGFCVILSGINAYVQLTTGVGIMGGSVYLPYKLTGLLFYTRRVFIPYILILVIWIADQARLGKILVTTISILLIHLLLVVLLDTSKGMLLVGLIPLVVLWTLTGRLSANRILLIISCIILTAVIYSSIQRLRTERIRDSSAEGFSEGIERSFSEERRTNYKKDSVPTIMKPFWRLVGIDELCLAVFRTTDNFSIDRVSRYLLDKERAFVNIYTQDIANFGRRAIHGEGPGIFGSAYVIGGTIGVIISTISYVIFIFVLWQILKMFFKETTLIASGFFLMVIIGFADGGGIIKVSYEFLMLFTFFALAEFLLRVVLSNKSKRVLMNKK